MTVQYSIQKMVSDGTLSTIALGIQYLQRNDIYIRIAGEETPQSGAPSGYTWSFIDNTTLKILPVIPSGIEVVVYRRTDVDAMYNIYSQNAQFDEATIDENNQQLLYIAQEYLEQGLPGAGVDTIEFLRDDDTNTYYRIKRTDGSYSDEFAVPSVGSNTRILAREALRRSCKEAGFNLVGGSFELGGTLVNANDVILYEMSGKVYSGPAGYINPGSTPTNSYVDQSSTTLRGDLASDGAYLVGFKDTSVADALSRTYNKSIDGAVPQTNISVALRAEKQVNVNIVPISDSFGDGVGASNYANRFLKLFEWAVNHSNIGGFGYASDTRLIDTVNIVGSGVTTNGTVSTDGALGSRVTLAAGQYIDITNVQVNYADLWYDGGLTTGDLQVSVNGELYRSVATVKTTGIKTTFSGVPLLKRTKKTDVLRFVATSGYVSITALHLLRGPSGGIWQAKISHGGWSYKSFDNQVVVDELTTYAKWRNAYVVYMLLLGTNSIYNGNEAQSPSDMVASLTAFMAKLTASTPNCGFIIGVPPKSIESIWPVIKAGYTYSDYVNALIGFGKTNNIQLVRFDTLDLLERGMYSDGIHPNDSGHILYAKRLCESIGLPFVPYSDDMSPEHEISSGAVYNDSWGTFLDSPGYVPRVRRIGNIAHLAFGAQPNGSASLTILTIPQEYHPILRNVNCVGFDALGPKQVSVLMNGSVALTTPANTYLSVEVSWVIDNTI